MVIRNYWLLVYSLVLFWVLSAVFMVFFAFSLGEPGLAIGIFAATLPAALPGGLIWMIYTLYVAYRHLPKVDQAVDPEAAARLMPGDILSRVHRLVYYYGALTNNRFNTRVYPGLDFKKLPEELQLPLKIYGHWLLLTVAASGVALIAMKWAEAIGAMPMVLVQ